MTPEYLTQRFNDKLWTFWFGSGKDLQLPPDLSEEQFLEAFTIDNCVEQYEACLEYTWEVNDWVRYCYPEAKMAKLAWDESMEAAAYWKLGNWLND